MAAAVLLVNNHRDVEGDRKAGRRTLGAVLGPARSRTLHAALMLLPFVLPLWLAFSARFHATTLLAKCASRYEAAPESYSPAMREAYKNGAQTPHPVDSAAPPTKTPQ